MRDLGDNMNSINPDDIETMTVLKGATAAAIYGSRAANGAIIITTKSGQRNQGIGVEYSGSFTAQQPLNYMDDLQYVYGQGRLELNQSLPLMQPVPVSLAGAPRWMVRPFPFLMVQCSPIHPPRTIFLNITEPEKHGLNTLAFSGGNEKGSFRASFSNTDADGIDPYNKYKKNIANLGVNYDITKKVNFSMNVNYTNEKYINPPELGQQGPGAVNFFTRLSNSIPYRLLKIMQPIRLLEPRHKLPVSRVQF